MSDLVLTERKFESPLTCRNQDSCCVLRKKQAPVLLDPDLWCSFLSVVHPSGNSEKFNGNWCPVSVYPFTGTGWSVC